MVRSAIPQRISLEENKKFKVKKYKEATKEIKFEGRYVQADSKKIPHKSHRIHNKTKLKSSLVPGAVVIILSGRFRGHRAVFLKQLESGLLLVSGPFSVSGVPLRRFHQAYVIGTSTTVDVSGVDVASINDDYFARVKSPKEGEAGFFNIAEKINPEWLKKRQEQQAKVDGPLLKAVEKVPQLKAYLNARFTLRNGDKPHLMKF